MFKLVSFHRIYAITISVKIRVALNCDLQCLNVIYSDLKVIEFLKEKPIVHIEIDKTCLNNFILCVYSWPSPFSLPPFPPDTWAHLRTVSVMPLLWHTPMPHLPCPTLTLHPH